MKTIPEIRERVAQIGRGFKSGAYPTLGQELIDLAEAMKRRPAVRRARKRSSLTDTQICAVKDYAASHSDASYYDIAMALDVNAGRISEILAGHIT